LNQGRRNNGMQTGAATFELEARFKSH
jgi:hypothetical protein